MHGCPCSSAALMGDLALKGLNHPHGSMTFDVDEISVEKDSGWREIDRAHVEYLMGMVKKGQFGLTVFT